MNVYGNSYPLKCLKSIDKIQILLKSIPILPLMSVGPGFHLMRVKRFHLFRRLSSLYRITPYITKQKMLY